MKLRLQFIALLVAGAFAVQCKADYLFTYQDSSGDVVGFNEPTLQPAGQETSFLFDKNSVSGFVFGGNAPSTCGALGSLNTGCTGLVNSSSLVDALFPNGSFNAPGVFSGSNGATVDIIPYSGYLFTYQDTSGNILAFSEPTLQSSGSTNQFLFSIGGPSSFTFSGDTGACGAIGAVNGIGCTQLNGSLATAVLFPIDSFSSVGTFTGGSATVNIVHASATPEPRTTLLFPPALIVGGFLYWRRWRRGARSLSEAKSSR